MGWFVLRLCVAGVLAVAGLAKLARLEATREMLTDFGIADGAAPSIAVLLPAAELICAALLCPDATARPGSALAAGLLLLFTLAIVRLLALQRRPPCACFGALGSARPISSVTLVRNAVLFTAALAPAIAGPGHAPRASSGTWLIIAGAALVTGVLLGHGAVTYQLFRQNGRLLVRIHALETGTTSSPTPAGPPLGVQALPFTLESVDGQRMDLDDLLVSGRRLVLGFVDPHCAACTPAISQLARVRQTRGHDLSVVLIVRGTRAEALAKVNGHGFDAVLLTGAGDVGASFGVQRVPSALVVAADGRIASPTVTGPDQITALLETTPSWEPVRA